MDNEEHADAEKIIDKEYTAKRSDEIPIVSISKISCGPQPSLDEVRAQRIAHKEFEKKFLTEILPSLPTVSELQAEYAKKLNSDIKNNTNSPKFKSGKGWKARIIRWLYGE